MKTKRLALATLALTTPSALAVMALGFTATPAQAECSYTHTTASMSCVAGSSWDADTQTCVPDATG